MTSIATVTPIHRRTRRSQLRRLALATALTTAFIVGALCGASALAIWAILSGS